MAGTEPPARSGSGDPDLDPIGRDHTTGRSRIRGSRWRRVTPLVRIGRVFTPIFAALAALKLFHRRVDLGEMTMLVSALDLSVGRGLIRDRVWEQASTRVLRSVIRPGDHVVDVGAHVGYFTVLASNWVGPTGRVHAFEPDPRLWDLLTANVEENRLTNVTITPAALGHASEDARIRLSAAAPRSCARMLRLDDHFSQGERVDVVKMDIDGGEIGALEGMRQVLKSNGPVYLLIEHDPWQQRLGGWSIATLHETLQAVGFRPLLAIDEGTGSIEEVDWAILAGLASRTLNLLMVKDEHRSSPGDTRTL